ncbi:MAG: DUF1028 domain-containing protein [Chloroflexota bacterium]
MTYSIVARDPGTGELGVGVQTHQPSCAIVPWVRFGVGAVATQSFANGDFGPQALALMANGLDGPRALAAVIAGDAMPQVRQLAVMDAAGGSAVHTGDRCIPFAGHHSGENYTVQANMMLNETVPAAMAAAFEGASGPLALRILAALEAAEAQGGDIRGSQSAVMRVQGAGNVNANMAWDLRIDNQPDALVPLRRLVQIRLAGLALEGKDGAEAARGDALAAAFARYERAHAIAPSDEQTFWFGVRGLAQALGADARAAEVLTPLFARAPRWRELLLRLPMDDLEGLKGRFREG